MSSTTSRNLLLQSIALIAVVLNCCSAAQADLVEALYDPVDSELTINVIADDIFVLDVVGQLSDGTGGFVNFTEASSTTPLGVPVVANSVFVQYSLGTDLSGDPIYFTPGSYNIGAVFDPGIKFTLEPEFQDTSIAEAANGDTLGPAALSINTSNLAPITSVTVPEPGALPILLMGIATLIFKRRRWS